LDELLVYQSENADLVYEFVGNLGGHSAIFCISLLLDQFLHRF